MKRSQQLTLTDVRGVFRILGDARDLRYDQSQQETNIVDEMVDLLDASFGFAVRFDGFRLDAPTKVERLVPGTIQDPQAVHYLSHWGKNSNFDDTPMMNATRIQAGPVYSTTRSDVLTFDNLKSYRIYPELIEPAEMYDVLMTFFRYPGCDITRGYIFHRTIRQKEYELRHRRLAQLFSTELHRLYHEGSLEPRGLLNTLPPRLARIARQLKTGQSQRQIARSQNLSYHTVRSYTKELYDTVGVGSREELVAKLFNRGAGNSSN